MSEITLEKIDIIRERTGVTYSEAKEALEACDGNVVDALIHLEGSQKSTLEGLYTTKDEFINWVKDAVKKGNVSRIKIKKEDKVIVDVPVNAGIAAGVLAGIIWAPLLAIGVLTAVVTKVTVEITKDDGSVEIVNKIIKNAAEDVKEKVSDVATEVKEKFSRNKESDKNKDESVYTYTVKFEDLEENDKQE